MKRYFVLLVLFAITLGFSSEVNGQNYKVIVNTDNPVKEISRKELDKVFLKKVTKWENDVKIKPINLNQESDVRESFSKDVHKKNVSAIKAYWQKQIFTGKGVPPVEKSNDREIIDFVKSNPGAVGYISGGANTNGVKTITVK